MLYLLLVLYDEQEKNYVARTDKQPITDVVQEYYAKYVLQQHEYPIVNAIRYCVRHFRQHNGGVLTSCAQKAVQIIYENKDIDFMTTVSILEVCISTSSQHSVI